ncbi:hypothetical protein Pmani_034778 [Petrolisthes manimaculis]|uniref:Uncharacterized protein n=1 Tax=Petrolisthes manimaculis TaxID=1843537 RepID=A0AAE1TP18_9EUCA|nr:hypothetical protein Pmani_034778 [Petrolisthes manimaculis]
MEARTRQGGKKKCRECNQFKELDEDMRCTTCVTPEDKDECRTYKRKVTEIDNAIKCDGCKTWNHIEKTEAVDIVQKTAEVVIRHIEEKEKREKRQKNVVLYNVPESSHNEV